MIALRKAMVLAYLMIYVVAVVTVLGTLTAVSPWIAIAAGSLYLLSHALRAMRLAALSVDMLGTSARTTVALHFATAPFALLMPLKLGELVRLYALWRVSGTAIYAVIVLLIDRMYDSLFLFPIVIVLIMQGGTSPLLAVFTVLMATIPLTVIVIGPRILTELQRYVVASHNNPVTVENLSRIDVLRRLVSHAAQVSRRQAPQLCVLSFIIWLCEFLLCAILVGGAVSVLDGSLDLLGARLVTSLGMVEMDTLAGTAVMITLMAQLLPWPLMVMIFLNRAGAEPQRAHAADRIKGRMIG